MKQRKNLLLILLAAFTIGFVACSKEKKNENEEKVREIESQYENTADDFNDNTQDEQKLEEVPVITTSNENDLATKELRKYVTIHRDLVKKYKATGDHKYKEQALIIEEKAAVVQKKLSSSQYQAKSPQIRANGDLFLEMDASIADLRN